MAHEVNMQIDCPHGNPPLEAWQASDLSLKHLRTISTHGATFTEATAPLTSLRYRTYKARWFGVLVLSLLNIASSLNMYTYSSVSDLSADFLNVTESKINILATAYMACLCACCPLIIWMMHYRGFKFTLWGGSVCLLIGSWLRYAGTIMSSPSYVLVMVGQVLTGIASAAPLVLPSFYTNVWFTGDGKIGANAIMSLSNPFGAAVAQFLGPAVVSQARDIPNLTLYVSATGTTVALLSVFIPGKPVIPPGLTQEEQNFHPKDACLLLLKHGKFWLFFLPFAVYVGLFNAFTTLINQILSPYGVTHDTVGYCGATLIGSGIVAAIILSPIIARFQASHLAIKTIAPIIGTCYLVLVWTPPLPIGATYAAVAALGAGSFSLLPIVLELMAEITRPLPPELTSSICWMGGQLLAVVFLLVMPALKADDSASPPQNMANALIFEGVVAMVSAPLPLFEGFF